jgi:hypothetical protein
MNTQLPPLEARVSAVERMQTILQARIEEVAEEMATSVIQLEDHQIQTERRLDPSIEELSRDMTASFKQLARYQIQTERTIDARFDKIEGDIAVLKKNVVVMEAKMATKGDVAAMEGRLKGDMTTMEERLKGDIATVKEDMVAMEGRLKGDMATMETRMLDAFKQLLTVIDTRLPPAQA